MTDLTSKNIDPMRLNARDYIRWDVAREEEAAGNHELAQRIRKREVDTHFAIWWRSFMATLIHPSAEFEDEWDRLAELESA